MGRIRIEGAGFQRPVESAAVVEAAIRSRYGGGETPRRAPGEPRVVSGATATERAEVGGRSYVIPSTSVAVRRGGETTQYQLEQGKGVEIR